MILRTSNSLPVMAIILLCFVGCVPSRELLIVGKGGPKSVRYGGSSWDATPEGIKAGGVGRRVFASLELGHGDAVINARLRIDDLKDSQAAFIIGDGQFGFEGWLYGDIWDEYPTPPGKPLVKDGQVFDFEVERRGDHLSFRIDGQGVYETKIYRGGGALEDFGFEPGRGTIHIYDWSARGSLVDLPIERRPDFLVDVFKNGPNDVPQYRIPALVTTNQGTLVAFAEVRRDGEGDTGNIDIVRKRSTDGGVTWGPEKVVFDLGSDTCQNSCAVVDRTNGRLWLACCWNRATDGENTLIIGKAKDIRRTYMLYSDDDGKTFSEPREISRDVRGPDWRWYATGPGSAIQLTRGKYAGRIVIPANHSDHHNPIPAKYSHLAEA